MKNLILVLFFIPSLVIGQSVIEEANMLKTKTSLLSLKGKLRTLINKCDSKSLSIKDLGQIQNELNAVEREISDIYFDASMSELSSTFEAAESKEEEENKSSNREYKSDIEDEDDDIDISKYISSRSKGLNDFAFTLGWGINGINTDLLDTRLWGSNNWEFGFAIKRYFTEARRARIIYGLSFNSYSLKLNEQAIHSSREEPRYNIVSDESLDNSKFRVSYLTAPIGLGIKTSKKTELYVGGHVGLRLNARMETAFENERNEDVEQVARSRFGTNRWQYGVDLAWGSDDLKLFGKYDLNNIFESGDASLVTVGLRIGY